MTNTPTNIQLLRGKSGSVIGSLNALLVSLKGTNSFNGCCHCVAVGPFDCSHCGYIYIVPNSGLPSTYNKDLQEDKQNLFTTVDTINVCLQIATGVLATLTPNADKMRSALVPEMLVRADGVLYSTERASEC